MSDPVRREERRLRRVFERALLVALATSSSCSAPDESEVSAGEVSAGEDVSQAEEAFTSEASCAPAQYTPDPPDKCGKFVHLACGLPPGVEAVSNCYLWLNDCKKICPGAYFNCHATEAHCKDGKVVPDAKGNVDIDCVTCAKGVGRIPAGLAPEKVDRSGSAIGDYLASAGHLEAAAVHAFRRLRRDLAAHGAPARLVRGAREGERDEVRHARSMSRAARRFGAKPAPVRIDPPAARPFDEIALENAVEGCVRETYGALVAAFQAAHARDAEIADLMRSIAADETRHAALSWAIARWAERRLEAGARAEIAARRREAVAALRREAEAPVPEELRTLAGMPDPDRQRWLIDMLEEGLWLSEPRA